MVNIVTAGRTDVEEYFRLSGIREYKKLAHTPFLVFEVKGGSVEVKIVDRIDALLDFPDATKVMSQWRGEWRSDFFQFAVGQLREYINKHPKTSGQIV